MCILLEWSHVLQVVIWALITCQSTIAEENQKPPATERESPVHGPYDYHQAIPEPIYAQPHKKSFESPPEPYSHAEEPAFYQPAPIRHQPEQPNRAVPELNTPEETATHHKSHKEPTFNQPEARQPDYYSQPKTINKPEPQNNPNLPDYFNQPRTPNQPSPFGQPDSYNQHRPFYQPEQSQPDHYGQHRPIGQPRPIHQPRPIYQPEPVYPPARRNQPDYYHQPRTDIRPEVSAFNQPGESYQSGPELSLPPHVDTQGSKPTDDDFKVVYYPDTLYEPDEIYRASPFYNAQPGHIDYAPVSHTRLKYRSRKINKSPPFYNDSEESEPKPSDRRKPARARNSGRSYRILAPRYPTVYQTPPVYTSFSEDVIDPAPEYIQPRKPLRPPPPPPHVHKANPKSPHSEFHRKHNIPVPFIKVIKFYPLDPEEFDSDEDDQEPRNDRGYKHKIQGDGKVESSNQTSKSGSVSSNNTYDQYRPVYYDPPTYIVGRNNTETKDDGLN